jgi:hypothetical protein
MRGVYGSWAVSVAMLAACGGSAEPSLDTGGSTSGPTGGGGQVGASGGNGAPSGGNVGLGGTSTGGVDVGASGAPVGGTSTGGVDVGASGAPGATVDCSGSFGAPVPLFEVEPPFRISSPSVTADGLELFYVSGRDDRVGGEPVVRLRAATSSPFGEAQVVDGVQCTTGDATLDVSNDGLRLYYACWEAFDELTDLRLAERGDRGQPFVDSGVVGTTGVAAGVSADELTVYSSGLNLEAPLRATRDALGSIFGDSAPIPGLEAVRLISPDISGDDLVLFGSTLDEQLVFATRTSATEAFGPMQELTGVPSSAAAPNLSADCRTLYVVGEVASGNRAVFQMAR